MPVRNCCAALWKTRSLLRGKNESEERSRLETSPHGDTVGVELGAKSVEIHNIVLEKVPAIVQACQLYGTLSFAIASSNWRSHLYTYYARERNKDLD